MTGGFKLIHRCHMIGSKFNRWTVLEIMDKKFVLCRCECGTEKKVNKGNVRAGLSKSCGCLNREKASQNIRKSFEKNTKHRMCGTPEYRAWMAMKSRCTDPTHDSWDDYGGRDIKVCERWLGENGFAEFYADLGPRPSRLHSLDRRDNDGGYNPNNCHWATAKEQQRNRRNNRLVTYEGVTKSVVEWCEEYKAESGPVASRLDNGWDLMKALKTPVFRNNLTEEQLAEIRRRYHKGSRTDGAPAMAKEFGVSQQTIQRVVHNKQRKYKIQEEPDEI